MDDESLFGSPPSSPRGKSPPLSLALPDASSSSFGSLALPGTTAVAFPALIHNVGSIALPGSRVYAELPVASSTPPGEPTRRSSSTARGSVSIKPSAVKRTRSSAAASSRRSSSAVPHRRPTPPPIHIPDPSQPLPPNFLRSQSALLGTAGLVAGVTPSQLNKPRGSSPSHPIIIEEDHPRPPPRPRRKMAPLPFVDPALLSCPSNQAVVSVLVAQKDIFPVLENIFKLLTEPDPAILSPPRTGFERRTTPVDVTNNLSLSSHISKRRKLHHVPAGATDWDVPYPFAAGHGPADYKQNWRRDRAKRLVGQLMTLIKDAARIAATKKYLKERAVVQAQQHKSGQASSTFPTFDGMIPSLPHQQELSCSPSACSSPAPNSDNPDALDQLLSSLLATVPVQTDVDYLTTESACPGTDDMPFMNMSFDNLDPTQLDQGTVDQWLGIFNTFPTLGDSVFSSQDSQNSTPWTNDTTMHSNLGSPQSVIDEFILSASASASHSPLHPAQVSQQNLLLDSPNQNFMETRIVTPELDASPAVNNHYAQTSPMDLDLSMYELASPAEASSTTLSDSNIDPFLLSLSMPSITGSASTEEVSPIASSSTVSLAEGPPTPCSFGSIPDIAVVAPGMVGVQQELGMITAGSESQYELEFEGRHNSEDILLGKKQDKGKRKATGGEGARSGSRAQSSRPEEDTESRQGSWKRQAWRLDKNKVMERAQERMRELEVQIEQAKIRQWELAIEGYALSHMFTQV